MPVCLRERREKSAPGKVARTIRPAGQCVTVVPGERTIVEELYDESGALRFTNTLTSS
jgi:hypothetical protein